MTDNTIKEIIESLNNSSSEYVIFKCPLNETVDYAHVYSKVEKSKKHSISNTYCEQFFFIKNDTGVYVAAVNYLENNLHWYVLEKHRGNGYLTCAMKNIILPYIFAEKDNIKITIKKDNIFQEQSKKVALAIGFGHFYFDGEEYEDYEIFRINKIWIEQPIEHHNMKPTGITKSRANKINKELTKIKNKYDRLISELETTDEKFNRKKTAKDISEKMAYIINYLDGKVP